MIEPSSPRRFNNVGTTGVADMSKLFSIALALNLAAVVAPPVAQAAKVKAAAQVDRCGSRSSDIRWQCFLELGATCEPGTGRLWLRGPSAGTVLGEQRLDACIARKSAERRR